MEQSKQPHTPEEEWTYTIDFSDVMGTSMADVAMSDGTHVARIEIWRSGIPASYDETKAVAELIASAPTLRADNARLREAGKAVMSLIDDGLLVRNINQDTDRDWSLRALVIVKALKEFSAALAQSAEEEK